ncbi:MAG TPA: phosphoribosyltransferase family protein [Thermomicrobiaceae bacterium]|nr:phosphoribosyltransferase family protein [Thermomicrobiaceae bacterium]
MVDQFADRRDAGRVLATLLRAYRGRSNGIVLGLPRGGVPVAYEVALELEFPLDVVLVRKLGVPGHEELAMGAISSGGVRFLNRVLIEELRISEAAVEEATTREAREMERRAREYRDGRPPLDVRGLTAILVDDGLATGATMLAAVAALAQLAPARIVVAVPVGSPEACLELGQQVDEIVCAIIPERFHAVGTWFSDFEPTTDGEVRELLRRAAQRRLPGGERPAPPEAIDSSDPR